MNHFFIAHNGAFYLVNATTGHTVISNSRRWVVRFAALFVSGPVADAGDTAHGAAYQPQA